MTSPADTGSVEPVERRCTNCGAAAMGRFCSACGQALDVRIPTALEWIAEVADEVGAINNRLAHSVQTVFLKPWSLVLDWAEGRRGGVVSPIRLYLLGLALWGGFLALGQLSFGPEGTEGGMLGQLATGVAGGSMSAIALALLGPLAAVGMPVSYAAWSRLVFGRGEYPFGIHVLVALYLHSFLMLLIAPWVLATGFMLVFLGLSDTVALALFFGGLGAGLWVHVFNVGRHVFGKAKAASAVCSVAALLLHGSTIIALVALYGLLVG